MPKLIGKIVPGALILPENNVLHVPGGIRLSYAQAMMLPPDLVFGSLDTSDRGSKYSLAKRWYLWFAHATDVLRFARAGGRVTPLMLQRAIRVAEYHLEGPRACELHEDCSLCTELALACSRSESGRILRMTLRDPETPSKTRDEASSPPGFRFATIAALIRQEGYPHAAAESLMRAWERYARYAMMSGKSPEDTAKHLARFERYQRTPWSRDPRGHGAPPEVVDHQIAEDLRRHALTLENSDPEHSHAVYSVADKIEFARDIADRDKVQMAADVLSPRSRARTSSRHRASSQKRPPKRIRS